MKIELKNCPCCNGEAEWIKPHYLVGNVRCKECGLSTLTGAQNQMVELWNRRVG